MDGIPAAGPDLRAALEPAPHNGNRLLCLLASTYGGALRFARDPRTAGVLRAGPRVGSFLIKGGRRVSSAGTPEGVFPLRPSPVLAVQALVDEVLIAAFHHPDLIPDDGDFAPAGSDVARARDMFASQGWLASPTSYHESPPPPDDDRAWHAHVPGLGYEHLTFTSGYEPHAGEPGRVRWLSHEANRTVHAYLSRAPGRARRTWLVCAPGFGMGTSAFVDLRAFRGPALHRKAINVAVPVLPLHGPRASGHVRGEDLMTIDMVDSLHGIAQAVWDVRRLIRWLHVAQGAERVGLIGYSFGALVASVVATLEPDLAFIVAGIPLVDLPEMFRSHSGSRVSALADAHGVLGSLADDVHRVVSPLSAPCAVPYERRYIFAGRGDRMSTFDQALRLWNHWDRPAMVAYQGGHIGFFWSRAARRLVDEAVDRWLVE
jgi:pimeloyl-ACP methyl ester carboxylesterase